MPIWRRLLIQVAMCAFTLARANAGNSIPAKMAMMATAAMNGAIYESTFNIFFKLHFEKTYDGILATPMGVTDVAVGPTADNLRSAIEGETYEYTEMYPGFAKTARDEGFEEIAEWLETLARAEKSHAGRFGGFA